MFPPLWTENWPNCDRDTLACCCQVLYHVSFTEWYGRSIGFYPFFFFYRLFQFLDWNFTYCKTIMAVRLLLEMLVHVCYLDFTLPVDTCHMLYFQNIYLICEFSIWPLSLVFLHPKHKSWKSRITFIPILSFCEQQKSKLS